MALRPQGRAPRNATESGTRNVALEVTVSLYNLSAGLMTPKLANLEHWIDQAKAFAEQRSFDPERFVQSRLFPDQFAFVRQVQSACDTAKFASFRVLGRDAPSDPDDETTLDELLSRVKRTCGLLGALSETDFEGAEDRQIVLPFAKDHWTTPMDYLTEFAVPNFFFHLTTAYAILRHNGVPLGKRTYLGSMTLRPLES